jgi:hypothetical protein
MKRKNKDYKQKIEAEKTVTRKRFALLTGR